MAKIDYAGMIDVTTNGQPTLGTIYINGIPFKGIADDSALGWEEFVWAEEPSRSNSFAFENMDDIDVGLVARCEVNFKYFNIQDFMKFREAIKQRHFMVKFFNVDTGEWIEREMYCSQSERQKLFYFNPELVGVLNFTIKLVATNRDVVQQQNTKTISYNANGYNITVSSADTVNYGDQYVLPSAPALTGYTFDHWDTKGDGSGSGSGWKYNEGQSITIFKDITLYPVYNVIGG